VDLVAQIVAEEERAIEERANIAKKKKKAWEVTEQPETSSGFDSKRTEDDMESLCTSMSFSTANISNLQEDQFGIDANNVVSPSKEKEVPEKKKKKLSRSRSQVVRTREKHFLEEEERKRAKILSKKTRTVVKKEKSEVMVKQQIWLHLIVHFARANKLQQHIIKHRSQKIKLQFIKLRKQSVTMIINWYRHYRLRRKMRQNAFFLAKIRIQFAVYVRRRRVQKCRAAAAILVHFINCVNGSSVRTQKLYKFRGRVIKIQTVFGQFYHCQRARLKLLHIAFQRELHLARLDRNQEKSNRERISVRSMKKTQFFGEAVQKLDDICSNLSLMIAKRNIVNNLKMKQLRQLQNEAEKKRANPNSPPIPGDSSLQNTSRRQYESILKRVLGNQRKRHILSQKGMIEHAKTRIVMRQAVDPADVKEFLTTVNHAGPTYLVLDHKEVEKFKYSPLILLTGGGGALHELRDIARRIVAEEDEEKMNYEIQRTLLKEFDDDF
jgi:hypothetical protein